MLAQLKSRDSPDAPPEGEASNCVAVEAPPQEAAAAAAAPPIVADDETTRATCDVLCSLGVASSMASYPSPTLAASDDMSADHHYHQIMEQKAPRGGKGKTCPKQHQLPMFLSKTYHMIDRCDQTIATWSAAGDNFVVKNVEKFAGDVLPLYFKHSNFSSFARQLNFYGFRKLRTDPILTSDVDPRTACHVRFYHEKFQKDRPELLHQIKRATKSDQQSKDDVDSLKHDVTRLKDCMGQMSGEMDRKLAEMSYEYNRRITTLSAEYDKLAALVTQILATRGTGATTATATAAITGLIGAPDVFAASEAAPSGSLMHSLSQVAALSLQSHLRPAALRVGPPSEHPLSAVLGGASTRLPMSLGAVAAAALGKRGAPADETGASSSNTRPRMG